MARKITGAKVTLDTNDSFEPIPKGTYRAFIYEVKAGEYGPNAKNAGREYYNIQLRIEGPTHQNRRVFTMVGLFPQWSSGSDNFMFFQLFAALRGISQVELRKEFNENGGIEIPDPEEMEGRLIEVRIGIEKNTYNGVTEDRNNVQGFAPVKEGGGASASLPTVSDTVVELEL